MILTTPLLVTAAGERTGAWLRVEDGVLRDVGSGAPPRRAGEAVEELDGVVLPGFVDGHAHGALGHDFSSCTAEEARAVAAHHADRGTTDLVASLATAPLEQLREQLARLAPLVADGTLAGLHLEGPYLSAERRGAHDPALLRRPDPEEVEGLVRAARGALRLVTLAPELPGAGAVLRLLVGRGVRVCVGHTACSAAVARAALAAGATGFTHLFNGMPPVAGREPGPVAAALEDPRAHLELVADGHHLAEETIDLVRRVAPGRAAVVSDAMAATGLGDGEYVVAGSPVRVDAGVARTRGGSLAGSTTPLGGAAERLLARDLPLPEIAALTSAAAARFLGLRRGVEVGAPADLVHLRPAGPDGRLAVHRALRRGAWTTSR